MQDTTNQSLAFRLSTLADGFEAQQYILSQASANLLARLEAIDAQLDEGVDCQPHKYRGRWKK